MKKIIDYFKGVKSDLQTIQSLLARMVYLLGIVVENIKYEKED